MPVRAVIFDFGGVLMRTHDYTGRRKWEACLGLPQGGLEELAFGSEVAQRGMIGEVPMEAAWEYVADTFRLSPPQVRELVDDFWSGDRIDYELVDFLAGLRPRYRTGLLSNAWENARQLFEQFDLGRAFDAMVVSAEEHLAKPDPRIYRIALDRLGVRPEEAVFVDDVAANVAAARALGMAGIQFRTPEQAMADVRALLDGRTLER